MLHCNAVIITVYHHIFRPSGLGGFAPAPGPGGDANPPNLVYPAGMIFVRCGWVAETLPAGSRLDEAVVGSGKDVLALTFENPLADLSAIDDMEAGRSLMPPLPHLTIDRILRRAAERVGVNKVRVGHNAATGKLSVFFRGNSVIVPVHVPLRRPALSS